MTALHIFSDLSTHGLRYLSYMLCMYTKYFLVPSHPSFLFITLFCIILVKLILCVLRVYYGSASKLGRIL